MEKMKQFKVDFRLILILAILILCAGFIFISCGTSPQLKITDPDTGQFAIDGSLGADLAIYLESDFFNVTKHPAHTLSGKALTVEAWVKRKAASATNFDGAIWGRMVVTGAVLFIADGVPKFSIKRSPENPGTTEAAFGACVGVHATSTECVVSSGVTLAQDDWTHVAGVLTTENQGSNTAGDCDADPDGNGTNQGAEIPHLAIYIDGVLMNCANTSAASDTGGAGRYALNPGDIYKHLTIGVVGDGVSPLTDPVDKANTGNDSATWTTPIQGVIDEVRSWMNTTDTGVGIARTQSQIQECMNRELGFGGVCNINDPNLLSYYRFNEGKGHSTTDWAGLGNGTIETVGSVEWDGGWADGPPITAVDITGN